MEKSYEKAFRVTFEMVKRSTVGIFANDAEQASWIVEDTCREDFEVDDFQFKLVSVVPLEKT